MEVNESVYLELKDRLDAAHVTLVAVSKTKPPSAIQELYDLGQRDFAENYVQELLEKKDLLPKDIRWHFIGHLQTNKVKLVIPHVFLIHSVDSTKLFNEIQKEAVKQNKEVNILLQVHIAAEATKYGFSLDELTQLFGLTNQLASNSLVHILGFMGMASLTDDTERIKNEFVVVRDLAQLYQTKMSPKQKEPIISMGMSSDYEIALASGSTMLRLGSVLFGKR